MDKSDILKKIVEDEDYIRCPKCANSLAKYLAKNDRELENSTIARLLMISEEEVEEIYQEAAKKLREKMAEDE